MRILCAWGSCAGAPRVVNANSVTERTLLGVEMRAAQARRDFFLRAVNAAPHGDARARCTLLNFRDAWRRSAALYTEVLMVTHPAGTSISDMMPRFPAAVDAHFMFVPAFLAN